MEANKSKPPPSAWRANRRLRASAWSTPQLAGEDHICRTLGRSGDLAPDGTSPSWSFHLGLPDTLGNPRTTHLANGYVLEFPHLADPPRITCLAVNRGLYAGSTSLELSPTLFSPGKEVDQDGEDQWLRLPDQTILLRVKKNDEGTQFVLYIGSGTDDAIRQATNAGFEKEIESLVQTEFALRAAFWTSLEGVEGEFGLLADAVEEVVFHLEAPTDNYSFRWSAAQLPDAQRFDVDQLYPLVLTWLDLDSAIAQELVAGILTLVQPDGATPSAYAPGQPTAGTPSAPWPYLARCVLAVADDDLSRGARETLRNYLAWIIGQLDSTRTGMLCWRSADEAFIPDTYDENIASPALSAFVLAELDALEEVLTQVGEEQGLSDDLQDARERIHAQLASALWSEEHGIYRDRYLTGASTSRETFAGLMPLAWSKLPANRRSALIEMIGSPTHFSDPDGVPLWQEWENDPTPPPIPVGYQLLLLDAMSDESEQEAKHDLQDRVAGAIVRQVSIAQTFPTQLRASAQSAGDVASPTIQGVRAPVIGACLALNVLPAVYRRSGGESVSQFWSAVDRHGMTLLASVIGVIALLVIGSALNLARKPSAQNTAAPQTTGLVQELMRQGNLTEALELLNETEATADQESLWLTRASIYYRMDDYADAEREYRAMIEKDFHVPSASLNLALTLFKQGQYDEAAQLYESCVEQYSATHPEIGARAKEARRFIRLYRDTLVPKK